MERVIHCCWFGGHRTALADRCRESWRRFAPEFEVREWDLARVRKMDGWASPFFDEAVRRRRWAFAADWLRFQALYAEGGVYLDFDLELVRPLREVFGGEWCAGQWLPGGRIGYEPGAGLALERGSPVAAAVLARLRRGYAEQPAGEALTDALAESGLPALRMLPPEVMCPLDLSGHSHADCRTVAVHHFAMSWASPRRKLARWLNWHGCRPLVDAALRFRSLVRFS